MCSDCSIARRSIFRNDSHESLECDLRGRGHMLWSQFAQKEPSIYVIHCHAEVEICPAIPKAGDVSIWAEDSRRDVEQTNIKYGIRRKPIGHFMSLIGLKPIGL